MFNLIKQQRAIPTKSGWAFVLFILMIQLAAFNTGENLFYLVSSAIIGYLLVSWWATRKGIRQLTLKRTVPDAVHRGEFFASQIRLTNGHRSWPSRGVALSSKGWSDVMWVDSVAARASLEFRAYETMSRRGRHPLSPVRIETTFPFGLISRSIVVEDRETILVYPRVYPLTKKIMDELDDSGQTPKMSFNDGDEFFSLREYIPGDDIRHISWKISGRLGKLIIQELEPSISRMVVLVFDTRGVAGIPEDEEAFEQAMDLAASLAVSLLGLHYIVGLVLPDATVELGRGRAQATRILEVLANATVVDEAAFGDDWYRAMGDHTEASKIYLAGDPARWGISNAQGRSRVLDPRDALHG